MTAEIPRARQTEALSFFGPRGALARSLPGFEHRPQQVRMASGVGHVFDHGGMAIIEAGTGTGKSLAYLYPGLIQARRAGRPLIVSTNTINLQHQLFSKDLPLLAAICKPPPKIALLLGRHNYLCRRRFELALQQEPAQLASEILAALAGAVRAGHGERGNLGLTVPGESWSLVASDGEYCLRQRCPWVSACFWQCARRAAAEAEIILVNHYLLLADVAFRLHAGWDSEHSVLPAYDRVVFDEAHHLEDIATESLKNCLSSEALAKTLDRLHRRDGPQSFGLLPFLQLGLASSGALADVQHRAEARELSAGAIELVERARTKGEEFFAELATMVHQEGRRDGSIRQMRYRRDLCALTPGLAAPVQDLALLLDQLMKIQAKLLQVWEGENAENPETEEGLALRSLGNNLMNFLSGLPLVLMAESGENVYWLETIRRRHREEVTANMAPLRIGALFHQALLGNLHGVVFTSATLSVSGDFAFFRERLGLDLTPPEQRLEIVLDSPFDYRRQVLLAAVTDLPGPDEAGFPQQAAGFLAELLPIVDGGTLVLFTSYGALERVWTNLRGILPPSVSLLRQGERPRNALFAEFQSTPGAVLLATDSFWEGVDLPGAALSCVVLARLPFRVPTEPITEARAEYLAANGGNPFADYSLPQAIIKLKQGFGRLVRRKDDTGSVVILDKRVLTRAYGREFFASLPSCEECFGTAGVVLEKVKERFRTGS